MIPKLDAGRRARHHPRRECRPCGQQYRDHRPDLPMTGPVASTGKQERARAELYMGQHGDTDAGKRSSEVKDDTRAAEVTKRLAEELISNDHARV